MKKYRDFVQYINESADDIIKSYADGEYLDAVHEYVDGSEYVIYYAKSWDLVSLIRDCNYQQYQAAVDMVSDYGIEGDIDDMVSSAAYFILTEAIEERITELLGEQA